MKWNGAIWTVLDSLTHSKDASAGIITMALLDLLAITNFLGARRLAGMNASARLDAGKSHPLSVEQVPVPKGKVEGENPSAEPSAVEPRADVPRADEPPKTAVPPRVEVPPAQGKTETPASAGPKAGVEAPKSNVRRLDWRKQWKAS